MKLARWMLVLMLMLPLAPRARASGADAVDPGGGDAAPVATASAAPDLGSGPNTKGGVLAAAGCGFAIASMILAPNPLSAFAIGFDCGFFLIDAGMSPDR